MTTPKDATPDGSARILARCQAAGNRAGSTWKHLALYHKLPLETPQPASLQVAVLYNTRPNPHNHAGSCNGIISLNHFLEDPQRPAYRPLWLYHTDTGAFFPNFCMSSSIWFRYCIKPADRSELILDRLFFRFLSLKTCRNVN